MIVKIHRKFLFLNDKKIFAPNYHLFSFSVINVKTTMENILANVSSTLSFLKVHEILKIYYDKFMNNVCDIERGLSMTSCTFLVAFINLILK